MIALTGLRRCALGHDLVRHVAQGDDAQKRAGLVGDRQRRDARRAYDLRRPVIGAAGPG